MKGVISLRLEDSLLYELDNFAKAEGKTRSAVIKEAIRFYLKNAHIKNSSDGFVPFSEYRRVNDELKEALRRIGELEAEVSKLRKENEMLRQTNKKRRWFF